MTLAELQKLLQEKDVPSPHVVAISEAVAWAQENPDAFGVARGTLWPKYLAQAITP